MKELLTELRNKVLYLRNTEELSAKGELMLLHKLNALEKQFDICGVVNSKIIITADESCEMIKIEKEGNELFYGNETDFNRDAETFEELFKSLGVETVIIKKPYSEW